MRKQVRPAPPEIIKEALRYDPETGHFYWQTNIRSGSRAGTKTESGYVRIKFRGHLYFLHRLAWWVTCGEWPEPPNEIDHINGDRFDNRFCNLRMVTSSQNHMNRTTKRAGTSSRYKGVSLVHGRWQAHIRISGAGKVLGNFTTELDAAKAYDVAAREHFGEFACPNFPSDPVPHAGAEDVRRGHQIQQQRKR